MIEAVNSVVSNAPLLRGNAEAAAASRAGNPENIQVAAMPKAPYISPYIHMDVDYDMAVLQIRDSDTGDVVQTIPSDTSLELRSRERSAASERLVSPIHAQDVDFSAPAPKTTTPAAAIASLSAGVHAPGSTGTTGVTVFA